MQIYGPEDTIRAGASAKRAYLGWFSQAVVGRAAIPSFLPSSTTKTNRGHSSEAITKVHNSIHTTENVPVPSEPLVQYLISLSATAVHFGTDGS